MFANRSRWNSRPLSSVPRVAHANVRECIESHENNYTLIRIFLAISVIYFHSFALSNARHLQDHVSDFLLPITSVGGLAVEAFFFLSGLFVAQSLHRENKILSFAAKRFFRIWPGLFVCLLVTAIIFCAMTNFPSIGKIPVFSGFYDYVVRNSLLNTSYYIPGTISGLPFISLNGSIHTLPLEAKMYVVLALLGLIGAMSRNSTIMAAALVTMGVTIFPLAKVPGLSWLFPATYSHVAYTMFFAGVFVFGASKWIVPRAWQGVVLLSLAAVTVGEFHVILFYMAVIWAILFIGDLKWIRKIWRPRKDISYGIYIYGWPCGQMILLATRREFNPYFLSIITICLASLFALASWRFVEKPAIKMGHRLASKDYRQWWRFTRVSTESEDSYPNNMFSVLCAIFLICVAMQYLTNRYAFVPVLSMRSKITGFGPTDGRAGAPVNQQPDGSSAIWLLIDSPPEDGATVVFSGRKLSTGMGEKAVTATVDRDLLRYPGEKTIYIERRLIDRIERSNSVVMHITP